MGSDVSNRWLFTPQSHAAAQMRNAIAARIRAHMTSIGWREVASDPAADRSFVIGPPGRWMLLGDSGEPKLEEPQPREKRAGPELFASLSELTSLVEVYGSDSYTYRLRLFERGTLRDTFQNGLFPFYPFPSAADAAPLAGTPDRWRHLLVPGRDVDELRSLFVQSIQGAAQQPSHHAFLRGLAELLGLPEQLIEVGYTWNPEGVAVSYRQYVQRRRATSAGEAMPSLDAFTELHFAAPGSNGRGARRMAEPTKRVSKLLSLVLRHQPERVGLELDEQGWVAIEDLLAGIAAHTDLVVDLELLQRVVETNDKRRFLISPDGARIRANHGHTVEVDLDLPVCPPPDELFHGTTTRFLASIREEGLLPGNRHDVHLSEDVETAQRVGSRHGPPVVLRVRARAMVERGLVFRRSASGVWLTPCVPAEFLLFPDAV